jgi:NCS1 family nucleobase:cation symporter-1
MNDSPLVNADLAPVPESERTWSKWHIAALWVGMSVCIPTYMLAAGLIAVGMNWWQAVLTVMLGNVIVLVPMILNGHGGTKYGIPFPVLVRSSFGTLGAHVPSIARGLVACGWFGIQTWIGGAALYSILVTLEWVAQQPETADLPFLGISLIEVLCFLGFWLVHVVIVSTGIHSIKWLESYAAPFLIAAGFALLIWAFAEVEDVSLLFSSETSFAKGTDFWTYFFPMLTAMVGFWATLSLNIPDFTRYCRSQKEQVLGQVIGLPATMTVFCFIGATVTTATVLVFGEALWDPVDLVSKFESKTLVVVSLIAVLLATLSTNLAANVVSPANGFSNLAPKLISFRSGAIITCVIGILIMPWKLLDTLGDYVFTWLIGYSALLGPIAGIMLCDYFLIRRTRLNVEALYDPKGEYRGINWVAMVALVLAVLPNVPGFINAVTLSAGTVEARFSPMWDAIYSYAWFVGLAIGVVVYALGMIAKGARR